MAEKKKDELVLLNPGSEPVVYNDDAQSVEPGKKVTVERIDETGQRAIHAGRLTLLDPATTQEGDGETEEGADDKAATTTKKKPAAKK